MRTFTVVVRDDDRPPVEERDDLIVCARKCRDFVVSQLPDTDQVWVLCKGVGKISIEVKVTLPNSGGVYVKCFLDVGDFEDLREKLIHFIAVVAYRSGRHQYSPEERGLAVPEAKRFTVVHRR